MRRALGVTLLALSLSSYSASPQQAPTTGSVEGIVVREGTEQPIANAEVTLTEVTGLAALAGTPPTGAAANPGSNAATTVTTGADGKFVFKDVKPATYRVAATADNFIRMANGQRVPNDLGRLLFVEPGHSVTNTKIRIQPTGTITGRILDENGQPAAGVPVQLIRAVYQRGIRIYQGAGGVMADDRGVYRIFSVPPGRYYLTAGMPPFALPGRSTRLSLMYYPGVSGLDQAATMEVKAGNETSIDMRLKRVTKTFHVRGRVINAAGGAFPQDLRAMIGYRQLGGFVSIPRPNAFDPLRVCSILRMSRLVILPS